MRILLCLGDSCLCHAVRCQILAKCVLKLHFLESNFLVRDRHIILGKADIFHILSRASVKSVKFIGTEGSCDLTCAIRAEVEEDHGIFVLDRRYRLAVLGNRGRYEELIRHILCVGSFHCSNSALCGLSLALGQHIICLLHTIPAVITVHRIIASGNRSNLTDAQFCHLCFQCLDKSLTGSRSRVTSVQEAVYVYILYALSLGKLEQTVQMCNMAVYTTIRKKSV